jgi:hypothetical protein
MGEREMFLVLGAMIFFSMTSLSVNRFCLNNNEVMMRSEFDYYAISLAQGIIEEAKTRAFDVAVADENNLPPLSDLPGAFTGDKSLGPMPGEYYPNYNDVDDYNGLNLDITANINGPKVNYHVQVQVRYVEEWDLDTLIGPKKFQKGMIVTVTSSYISAPIVLSHVFSYYDFG